MHEMHEILYQCLVSSGHSNKCPKSKKMAPRKGFSPFLQVISGDLSPHLYWYVLKSKACGMTPTQFFKHLPVVSSFPDNFVRIERQHLAGSWRPLHEQAVIKWNQSCLFFFWTDICVASPETLIRTLRVFSPAERVSEQVRLECRLWRRGE